MSRTWEGYATNSPKSQKTSTKLQTNLKQQIPKSVSYLELVICLGFGVWDLELLQLLPSLTLRAGRLIASARAPAHLCKHAHRASLLNIAFLVEFRHRGIWHAFCFCWIFVISHESSSHGIPMSTGPKPHPFWTDSFSDKSRQQQMSDDTIAWRNVTGILIGIVCMGVFLAALTVLLIV
jgi:hypothetical protein